MTYDRTIAEKHWRISEELTQLKTPCEPGEASAIFAGTIKEIGGKPFAPLQARFSGNQLINEREAEKQAIDFADELRRRLPTHFYRYHFSPTPLAQIPKFL